MSLFIPKDVKENVARIIKEALSGYSVIDGYTVKRVGTDGANVHVMLKGQFESPQGATYMLNISVKEVR